MNIGVPKEVKTNENRVGLTPACVKDLETNGHEVFIETGAGEASGFTDAKYIDAGADILQNPKEIYGSCDMIVKVKEPVESECDLIKKDQLVFTYFHFASNETLTHKMIESGAICLAYETVELADRTLPLLIPMSEVAGRMAVQQGAKYLEQPMGGKGILLGGVPGVPPAKVMILGGGVVGAQAAKMAAGLGADVSILDINLNRLRYLEDIMPDNITTVYSNQYNIRKMIEYHDLIIGAVLIPGAKAPKLIKEDMLQYMNKGTVLVDVAVDQGGCIETCRPTTHQDPIFVIDGIVHYCVANMPGAVPYTSTTALTNATLRFSLELANKGWQKACQDNPALQKGLNIVQGKVVYKGVADAFDLEHVSLDKVLQV